MISRAYLFTAAWRGDALKEGCVRHERDVRFGSEADV
jgi:hypothetical protein